MRRFAPLLVALAVVALLVVIEALRPQPFDERLRLEREGTEPFDAEILYQLLPGVLDAPVVPAGATPFETLADSTLRNTAYLFLADDFAPDPAEAGRLLDYAERGNTVFVSARVVSGALFESLGAPADTASRLPDDPTESDYDDYGADPDGIWSVEDGRLGLGALQTRDTLRVGGARYAFPLWTASTTFGGLDSTRTDVLGSVSIGLDPFGDDIGYRINLLRVRAGRGAIVLHGAPVALTNAALAPADSSDAAAYLAAVLSFVPAVDSVFWDETYKPLRTPPTDRLTVVRRDPALRWAVGLVLLGTLFFVAFRGRRWQRAVPVVAPPPNAQREFARVLGRLHLTRGERGWLARRKARTARERLRGLGLGPDLGDADVRVAAARVGRSEAEAQRLFARLRRLEAEAAPSAADLLALDRELDAFFHDAGGEPAERTAAAS